MSFSFTIEFDANFNKFQRKLISSSVKFQEYCKQLDKSCFDSPEQPALLDVTKVFVKSVDWFGKNSDIVGFIRGEVIFFNLMKDEEPKEEKGFFLLRGNSVMAFVTVNKKKGIAVRQLKMGSAKIVTEPPAGMMDNKGNMKEATIDELVEECGIDMAKKYPNGFSKKVKHLGRFATSQGLLDEYVEVYWIDITLTDEEIHEMTTKIHGEKDSLEAIKVTLFDLNDNDFIADSEDCKLICGYWFFMRHLKKCHTIRPTK